VGPLLDLSIIRLQVCGKKVPNKKKRETMAGEGYRSKYIIGLGKDGGSHKKSGYAEFKLKIWLLVLYPN